ncbi:MAG: hypothetical protein IJ141_06670 [Lachnospiraceae bacterium]|nr:hypothetical protein [Lachnospiraceae bacterium]
MDIAGNKQFRMQTDYMTDLTDEEIVHMDKVLREACDILLKHQDILFSDIDIHKLLENRSEAETIAICLENYSKSLWVDLMVQNLKYWT